MERCDHDDPVLTADRPERKIGSNNQFNTGETLVQRSVQLGGLPRGGARMSEVRASRCERNRVDEAAMSVRDLKVSFSVRPRFRY